MVDGTLHVLADTSNLDMAREAASFDLYALGQTKVTIGDAADIRLPNTPGLVTLAARGRAAGGPEILVIASPAVLCNGRRILTDQPLYDGDVLAIGSARLRYENLQRRRLRRATPGQHLGGASTNRFARTDNSRR